MKKIVSIVALLSILFSAGAQTADDVVAKHVEAMGGLDKLKSIKTVYFEGVAVMQNGFEITSKTYRIQGKLYRTEIDFGRGSFTSIVTDKEGWFSNPRNDGAFEPLPAEGIKAQQDELECTNALVDYTAKGHKIELVGKETIEGNECYNLKVTLAAGKIVNYYVDNKNWYVVRKSAKSRGGGFGGGGGGGRRPEGEEVTVAIDYSDFKKTSDGYIFPMAISRPGMGGSPMKTIVEKLEINKEIDPKLSKPE